ncbi:hypothetical protein JIG36_51150 [Actinoplanes sp. LDG1-06]|uniref:Choice-of-anchor D domain-containing protein n=1 Tax=Paractinoplanes ovalisporus TaxID=2810368 RepID=A0ABS2AVH6_9ACTN|nr:hypothetical protein [Actinoplanes ovalisporus]MBM2623877.1 hypothetical protein [Actinoplanes ovalisporus]
MPSSQDTQRGSFFEAGWVLYLLTGLSLTFGAAQVAPDGWRRTTTGLLILAAVALGAAAYLVKRFRKIIGALGVLMLVIGIPFALLPSPGDDKPSTSSAPDFSPPVSPTTAPKSAETSVHSVQPSSFSTTSPAARIDDKPLTKTVSIGRSGEFFQGDLRVGISSVYADYSVMNIYSSGTSCELTVVNVGEAISLVTYGSRVVFNLVLLSTKPPASAELRLSRSISDGEQQGSYCS